MLVPTPSMLQIHAVKAQRLFLHGKAERILVGAAFFLFDFLRRGGAARGRLLVALDGGAKRRQLLVASADGGSDLHAVLLALPEHKEQFRAVIAGQRLEHERQRRPAAFVPQSRQPPRIALAGKDGLDDALGALPVQVAKDVMQLEVHLREHFLHALELAGGFTDHLRAVAHQITQGGDLLVGPEAAPQQPRLVQLLEPLRVADIGLAARHPLGVPRIDQADLQARLLQHRVKSDPVVARALQSHGFDPALQEPIPQGIHPGGKAGEALDDGRGAPHGDSRDEFLRPDIDAGRVRVLEGVEHFAGGARCAGTATPGFAWHR